MYSHHRRKLLDKKQSPIVYDNRLRPYQNSDVEFLSSIDAKGVFNEQRTGKTPTTIMTLKKCGESNNILIVPKSTITQWIQEYRRWYGETPVTPLKSWNKVRRQRFYRETKGKPIVLSYGLAKNDADVLIEERESFDAIVVDEAHRLRNYKGMRSNSSTQQAKAIMKLRKISKGAYALSGTPAPNYAYDIFGILAFLLPDLFTSYWQFIEYYFGVETQTLYNRGIDIKNPSKNFQSKSKEIELQQFLETISVQRKRRDVMEWIPNVDIEDVVLEMTGTQHLAHTELSEFYEFQDIICMNGLDTMTRLRQLTTSPQVLGLNNTGAKLDWIKDFIDDNPDTPIIIASMFTSALDVFAEHLGIPKKNIMSGALSAEERASQVDKFQKGQDNIMLANIDVIKEGLRLSRAEVIIVVDPALTYTDNLQLYDRLIPTTLEEAMKKQQQRIIRLYLNESIDMYLQKMLFELKKPSTETVNDYVRRLQSGRKKRTQI